jgi:hypothetical protein
MRRAYDPSNYDDYFCLKPPVLLWIALLYLSRAALLPLFLGLGSFIGLSPDLKTLLQGMLSVQAIVPSLFGATVLFAFFRRVPSASPSVRWIWKHGRLLLGIAAVADCVLNISLAPLWHGELNDSVPWGAVLAALYDVYFLAYILIARRVCDTFAQFPEPVTS